MQAAILRIWNGYKEYIIVVALLLISLTAVSLNENPAIRKVKTYAFASFSVLTSAVSRIVDPFQNSFEVEKLRETNARLMLQVNALREYGLQNEELKGMLGLKDSSDFPLIPTKIVSKYMTPGQGSFVVNIGENEGVKIGMPVINDQGLVGIIYSVAPDYSMLRTLRNRDLKFAVKNQRSRYDGVIEWNGSDLVIINVPKTFDMEVGDRIVTSDFSTKFPPSIPVGKVKGGTRDKTGIFNNITVIPFVDFVRVENVFVVGIVPSVQKNNLELNLLKK